MTCAIAFCLHLIVHQAAWCTTLSFDLGFCVQTVGAARYDKTVLTHYVTDDITNAIMAAERDLVMGPRRRVGETLAGGYRVDSESSVGSGTMAAEVPQQGAATYAAAAAEVPGVLDAEEDLPHRRLRRDSWRGGGGSGGQPPDGPPGGGGGV